MHRGTSTLARTTPLLLLCGFFLIGCGQGGDNQAKAPKGQTVARVGDEAITVTELENELRLANIPAEKQKDPDTLKRIVGDLVARKYLYRQAMAAQLDREPSVLLDVLRSRESVLANAMISRTVATKVSALSQTDIDKYIAAHPLKFGNRQLLSVEQITFQIPANVQAILDSAKDKKSLDEIDQLLTAMNVPHGRSASAVSSGDLPENLSSQIRAKKQGEVFYFQAGGNGIFFVIRREEPRPLVGEAATSLARQSLRAELLKSELGIASVAANLATKYEGDYANLIGQKTETGGPQK